MENRVPGIRIFRRLFVRADLNLYLTASLIQGEVVPGAQPATHILGGKEWGIPTASPVDKKHTFKVLAVDGKTGKFSGSDVV